VTKLMAIILQCRQRQSVSGVRQKRKKLIYLLLFTSIIHSVRHLPLKYYRTQLNIHRNEWYCCCYTICDSALSVWFNNGVIYEMKGTSITRWIVNESEKLNGWCSVEWGGVQTLGTPMMVAVKLQRIFCCGLSFKNKHRFRKYVNMFRTIHLMLIFN